MDKRVTGHRIVTLADFCDAGLRIDSFAAVLISSEMENGVLNETCGQNEFVTTFYRS
jgi:hypothetical protein